MNFWTNPSQYYSQSCTELIEWFFEPTRGSTIRSRARNSQNDLLDQLEPVLFAVVHETDRIIFWTNPSQYYLQSCMELIRLIEWSFGPTRASKTFGWWYFHTAMARRFKFRKILIENHVPKSGLEDDYSSFRGTFASTCYFPFFIFATRVLAIFEKHYFWNVWLSLLDQRSSKSDERNHSNA